jgi:hypothetical protein
VKIGVALREVHEAETELAADLLRVGERHKAEHDVFHMSRLLSGWCDVHVQRLSAQAGRYDVDLDARAAESERDRGVLARVREKGAELAGRRPEAGLLLLHDLRELHLAAARTSLAWTSLGQGAQAVADTDLLATVTACHPETIRTMKWTVQRVKDTSPQVLAS